MPHRFGNARHITRLCALVLFANSFSAKELYVSPGGDDGAAGTEEAPLKTLHAARDKVREINDGSDDVVVYLRGNANGGYHFLDKTLEFDTRDGGKNGKTVTWRAYPNETPVVSGGMRITGWTLHDQGKNIWKAEAPITKKIRNMTVDYFPAVRAFGKHFQQGKEWGTFADGTEGFFVGPEANMWGKAQEPFELDLHHPEDVELYRWDTWMSQQWCVEDQLTTGTNAKIKMQQPMWRIAQYKGGSHGEGAYLFFENDLSFLDFKNEFYYDRPNQTLFYIPRGGVDMNTAVVIVPYVEGLVSITGDSPTERINNLTFEGIAFHDDSYLLPKVQDSYGYVCVQSITAFIRPVGAESGQLDDNVTYWMGQSQIQSAVEVLFADNIHFQNCRFEYLGGGGINFMNDVHNSTVDGCIFRWTGSHAVNVGHDEHCDPNTCYEQPLYPFPADPEYLRTCSDITVSNNITRLVSWQFTHAPAIMVYFAKNFELTNNDLGPCGFNTVSIGWGWGRCDATKEHDAFYAAHNVIYSGCLHHGDCGTFYTLGDQHGAIAEENFFPNEWGETESTAERRNMMWRQEKYPDSYLWSGRTSGAVKGFYPDAGTKNIFYRDNVYEGKSRTASTWGAPPGPLTLEGGWYTTNGKGPCSDNFTTCEGATSYEPGNRPAAAQAVVDQAGPENTSLYEGLEWIPGEPNPVAISPQSVRRTASGEKDVTVRAIRGRTPGVGLVVPSRRRLSVSLYDMSGRHCATLFNGTIEAGTHRLTLEGHAQHRLIGTGSFLLTIDTEQGRTTVPVVVIE